MDEQEIARDLEKVGEHLERLEQLILRSLLTILENQREIAGAPGIWKRPLLDRTKPLVNELKEVLDISEPESS